MSINDEINNIESQFNIDFSLFLSNQLDIEKIKHKYLGRKGSLSILYSLLTKAKKIDKPKFGQKINYLKIYISDKIESQESKSTNKQKDKKDLDYSLPGKKYIQGSIHPITLIIEEKRPL